MSHSTATTTTSSSTSAPAPAPILMPSGLPSSASPPYRLSTMSETTLVNASPSSFEVRPQPAPRDYGAALARLQGSYGMGATGPRLPAKDRSSKDKDKSKSKKDKKDKNSQSQSQSAEGERKLGPDSGSGASLNNSGSGSSADLSKHIILSPVQIQVAALSSVDKSAGLAEMQSRYGLGGGGFLVPVYFQSAEGDKEHKSKSVKRTSGDGVKKASLKNPFNASWLSFAPHKR